MKRNLKDQQSKYFEESKEGKVPSSTGSQSKKSKNKVKQLYGQNDEFSIKLDTSSPSKSLLAASEEECSDSNQPNKAHSLMKTYCFYIK